MLWRRTHTSVTRLTSTVLATIASSSSSSRPIIASVRRRSSSSQMSNPSVLPGQSAASASAQSSSKTKLPEWRTPVRSVEEPVLKVWNSLTKSKVEFTPQRSRQVTWYNCGPTVYDASHMGHARNYVTQDVLRRIMRDYFAYDVHFVQNVTDIDDKIILRSRQEHLLNELLSSTTSLTPSLLSDAREAWCAYLAKNVFKSLPPSEVEGKDMNQETREKFWDEEVGKKFETDEGGWRKELEGKDEKFGMYCKVIATSRQAILKATKQLEQQSTGADEARALVTGVSEPLSTWLDKKHGHSLTSPSISRSLAAKWEAAFLSDMSSLNVLPPDTMTRVSEYVPEIVRFVEKIQERGFAYDDGKGNVWFDVGAFDGRERKGEGEEQAWEHVYAKLAPSSKGNTRLLDEGEGSLTTSTATFQKRSSSDFALWKSSKPGEPHWDSPWGQGRPGWHIECSVMATEILGKGMDIHSGGVDLMFPHHDNEVAQSEAYHDCKQWVNYFFHTGHLHIEGLKMSKSLKNFITIEEALEKYTARQLRLGFMMQTWNAKMDFKESAMTETKALEASFNNFFTNIKARISARSESSDGKHYYDEDEKALTQALQDAQHSFRLALCDSFDTPKALQVLAELVAKANVYLGLKRPNLEPVTACASWLGRMLRMFGLGEGAAAASSSELGWGLKQVEGESANRETTLMPYLRALSAFRDEVRKLAISKADPKEILALSDRLRDYQLADLGVALDDQEDGRALVKLVPASTLIEAREAKLAALAEKASKAAALKQAKEAAAAAKLERISVLPSQMFKPPHTPEGTYSAWDDRGLPTKDGEGAELSKSKVKGNVKLYETRKKERKQAGLEEDS